MFIDRADTYDRPHKENSDRRAPYQKRSEITPGTGWRNRLGRKGLGRPRIEPGGVCVCALLIEDGRSHDVRSPTLFAKIRIQLRYGCHAVVLELATACDAGLLD